MYGDIVLFVLIVQCYLLFVFIRDVPKRKILKNADTENTQYPDDVRRIYLVDSENISWDGMLSDNECGIDDYSLVIYFVNKNQKRIRCAWLTQMRKHNIYYFRKLVGTKNSLDFAISTTLGYLVQMFSRETEYVIVSCDRGYNSPVMFWKTLGYNVRCLDSVSKAKSKKGAEMDVELLQPLDTLIVRGGKPRRFQPGRRRQAA